MALILEHFSITVSIVFLKNAKDHICVSFLRGLILLIEHSRNKQSKLLSKCDYVILL